MLNLIIPGRDTVAINKIILDLRYPGICSSAEAGVEGGHPDFKR